MKNYVNSKWMRYKNKTIKILKSNNRLTISNDGKEQGFVILNRLFNFKNKTLVLNFEGKQIDGNGPSILVMDRNRYVIAEGTLNSKTVVENIQCKAVIISVRVPSLSKVEVSNVSFEKIESADDYLLDSFHEDTLVISPNYPTYENKYMCGFVHSRLVAYKNSGIKFDLAVVHSYPSVCKYNFEGIDAVRMNFFKLRNLLQTKKYKRILLHFFDEKYASVLDACNLDDTELFFWVHGPETLYWDWREFTTPYFTNKKIEYNSDQIKFFKRLDGIINRYNNKENVHWIFVSNWIKNHSEKLINIKFNNYIVIPNIIDGSVFKYNKKNPKLRKKIFFLRRFDNCNKYAIDVAIKTILELSRNDIFKDLEFNIYGTGDTYNDLIAPIKRFKNVHFYKKFLSHEEIAKIHKENGIALFPTRYDAQGVSMCEAAMSGLAVITSNNDAVKEFLPNIYIFCDTENPKDYASKIIYLYNNPKEFENYSYACSKSINEKCSYEATVQKEIDLFKNKANIKEKDYRIERVENPTLSVIIPSYNVKKYLENTVNTILDHKNAKEIEVIIVNDESKDNTLEIAKALEKKYNCGKRKVINIIDKKNGGHGSTINAAIQIAKGKYTRIIDGDDWVNSEDLSTLIDKLKNEDSDLVITNYCEDRAVTNDLIPMRIYDTLNPEQQYLLEDICYPRYGFDSWGPILATTNFKTNILRDCGYKLSEKSFYVDMEFDLFIILDAKTLTYYDLDIYRYFIGRAGQSISKESYEKNYSHHERVLLRLLEIYSTDKRLSYEKKLYLKNRLIDPMIRANYVIICDFLKDKKLFNSFDKKFKKYKEFYDKDYGMFIKLLRKSNGIFIKERNKLNSIAKIVRR